MLRSVALPSPSLIYTTLGRDHGLRPLDHSRLENFCHTDTSICVSPHSARSISNAVVRRHIRSRVGSVHSVSSQRPCATCTYPSSYRLSPATAAPARRPNSSHWSRLGRLGGGFGAPAERTPSRSPKFSVQEHEGAGGAADCRPAAGPSPDNSAPPAACIGRVDESKDLPGPAVPAMDSVVQGSRESGHNRPPVAAPLIKVILPVIRTLGGAALRHAEPTGTAGGDGDVDGSAAGRPPCVPRRLLHLLRGDPAQRAAWEQQRARQLAAEERFQGLQSTEAAFFRFSRQLGTYVLVSTSAGGLLAAGFHLADGRPHQHAVLWASWVAGVVLGAMIGAGQVARSQRGRGSRTVVVTGSTRGLGKALAREFLRAGDSVVVTSRSEKAVAATVAELQADMASHGGPHGAPVAVVAFKDGTRTTTWPSDMAGEAEGEEVGGGSLRQKSSRPLRKIVGIACNVHSADEVRSLSRTAVEELGTVDLWINNAGTNVGAKPFLEFTDKELTEVVSTNLMGSLICTREAVRVMRGQPRGGHVFNMDGAGSDGSSTPRYAAYGATKCALRQLHASLLEETRKGRVGVHSASPGMVLTDLLLSGATLQNKQVFNIVCEQPETVARALAPQMRAVRSSRGRALKYLTPPRIAWALVCAFVRRGRYFDEEGRAVYAAEADRLRVWGEGRARSPVTAAMEDLPSAAWLSLVSSCAICAYSVLATLSERGGPGA